jgi:hypothetical protein
MEKIKKFSNSVKKFIRTQKAQIRRQFWDVKKQEELIKEMYNKLSNSPVKPADVKEAVKAPEVKVKTKKEKIKK